MAYEIKKAAGGKFMFNLEAANHKVVLTSELYGRKSAALAGIASVQKHSPGGANYELKRSTANQPYFVLKASNGEPIGHSEMYSSDSAAKNGMESVKKNGGSKEIKDLT